MEPRDVARTLLEAVCAAADVHLTAPQRDRALTTLTIRLAELARAWRQAGPPPTDRTHCRYGHALTPATIHRTKAGYVRCKLCNAARTAAARQRARDRTGRTTPGR